MVYQSVQLPAVSLPQRALPSLPRAVLCLHHRSLHRLAGPPPAALPPGQADPLGQTRHCAGACCRLHPAAHMNRRCCTCNAYQGWSRCCASAALQLKPAGLKQSEGTADNGLQLTAALGAAMGELLKMYCIAQGGFDLLGVTQQHWLVTTWRFEQEAVSCGPAPSRPCSWLPTTEAAATTLCSLAAAWRGLLITTATPSTYCATARHVPTHLRCAGVLAAALDQVCHCCAVQLQAQQALEGQWLRQAGCRCCTRHSLSRQQRHQLQGSQRRAEQRCQPTFDLNSCSQLTHVCN